MTEVVITDLESGLRALFRNAYLTNLEIEHTDVSEADLETLEDLDPIEVLENFKDLVEALLSCKRDFKLTDKSEIVGRCEQFEGMLQKLEAEVRNHFRVEQQLKLHSDALQAKLDEMEKSEKQKDCSPELRKFAPSEHLRRQSMSTLLTPDKIEASHRRVTSLEREVAELKGDARAQRLFDIAEQKHRGLLRLEKECLSMKSALDKRSVELERNRQEYEQVLRELQLYRAKKTQEAMSRANRNSMERPLTERQGKRPSETDKKPEYRHSENSYSSRSKLDVTPPPSAEGKKQQHTRTTSERVKRPVTAVRPRANV